MVLMRTDPFHDIHHLTQRIPEEAASPTRTPLDAHRDGNASVVCFDLPGVNVDSIEVERNVLTVTAEHPDTMRDGDSVVVTERPSAAFSRRLLRGEIPQTDGIPIAERARPRESGISQDDGRPHSTGV